MLNGFGVVVNSLAKRCKPDVVMLNGFGVVVNSLAKRCKPYLPQICGTILWRLNNKSAKVRQQAADLISRIAVVMKTCQEVCFTYYYVLLYHVCWNSTLLFLSTMKYYISYSVNYTFHGV